MSKVDLKPAPTYRRGMKSVTDRSPGSEKDALIDQVEARLVRSGNRRKIIQDKMAVDMKYDPQKHHRKSIRLKGYNYSRAGAYFITICTRNRKCLFGNIVEGEMVLNDAGKMVKSVWNNLPNHYTYVELDQYVIMPNHFHGIVVLTETNVGAGFKPAPTANTEKRHELPKIVRGFKTFSSRRINELRNTPGVKLWQRNYYEHIIRNENELNQIRQYIIDNPAKWKSDRDNIWTNNV